MVGCARNHLGQAGTAHTLRAGKRYLVARILQRAQDALLFAHLQGLATFLQVNFETAIGIDGGLCQVWGAHALISEEFSWANKRSMIRRDCTPPESMLSIKSLRSGQRLMLTC